MSFDPVAMEYYPTIFFNEFWLLKDYLVPVNETLTETQISLTLSTMSLWKFSLFAQMDQAMNKQVCLWLFHVECILSKLLWVALQGLVGRPSRVSARSVTVAHVHLRRIASAESHKGAPET